MTGLWSKNQIVYDLTVDFLYPIVMKNEKWVVGIPGSMLFGAFALIVGIIQFNQIRFCTLNGFLID